MKKTNLLLSTLLLGGVMMSCGGGGSNIYDKNDNNNQENSSATLVKLTGSLADGYISGGNVEVRYLGRTVKTSSKSDGGYAVDISSDSKKVEIFASGGIDKDTDEIFEGLIRSSFVFDNLSNTKIWSTPLTTILASLIDDGKSESEAKKILNTHLGLEDGFDLLRVNPMGSEISDDLKIKLFKATQQIQRVSEIIKDVLGNDISYNDISKAIVRVMASDSGSDNIQDILKSTKLSNSVVAFIDDDKKIQALAKLTNIKVAVDSIVNLISVASIDVRKIALYSKSIELVSNSYELKAMEINIASDGDLVIDLKSDLDNITKTYTSLDEVNVLVLKAQALADNDDKTVSLYKFSRSIVKLISDNNTISELDNIHTEVNIADAVITSSEKSVLTAKINAGIVVVLPVIEKTPEKNEENNTTKNEDTSADKITEEPSQSQNGNSETINQGVDVPGIPSDNVGAVSNDLSNIQPDYSDGSVPKTSQGQPPVLGSDVAPSL